MAQQPHPRAIQAQPVAPVSSDTAKAVVVPEIGKMCLMRAVYGHMHHPFQVPVVFDTNKPTKVEVDRWVMIQYEAGKLAVAD